jgi:hypothetical protein
MTGQLTYLLAQEGVADLQRAADHVRQVRAAKGQRPLGHGRPLARLRGRSRPLFQPRYGQLEVKS